MPCSSCPSSPPLAASGASVAALALRRLAPRRNKDSTGGCQVLEDEEVSGRSNQWLQGGAPRVN